MGKVDDAVTPGFSLPLRHVLIPPLYIFLYCFLLLAEISAKYTPTYCLRGKGKLAGKCNCLCPEANTSGKPVGFLFVLFFFLLQSAMPHVQPV